MEQDATIGGALNWRPDEASVRLSRGIGCDTAVAGGMGGGLVGGAGSGGMGGGLVGGAIGGCVEEPLAAAFCKNQS